MRISDWSSDVCSSDLSIIPPVAVSRARKPIWVDQSGGDKLPVSQHFARGVTLRLIDAPDKTARTALRRPLDKQVGQYTGEGSARHRPVTPAMDPPLGRAACRERVCTSV